MGDIERWTLYRSKLDGSMFIEGGRPVDMRLVYQWDRIEVVPVSHLQGAVSTKITDEELDAAWSAWSERWVTSSGRDAMREALMTFARLRGGR